MADGRASAKHGRGGLYAYRRDAYLLQADRRRGFKSLHVSGGTSVRLKALKVIQIGDIHYPDRGKDAAVDRHDSAVAESIPARAALMPIAEVMAQIPLVCDEHSADIAAILFSGDLTSGGDVQGYEECVRWLNDGLHLTDTARWGKHRVHVVPGNHDVARELCNNPDETLKFAPFADEWSKISLPVFCTGELRREDITLTGRKAVVLSLNSCMGCGEKRRLPDKIRDQLHAILSKHGSGPGAQADIELIAETMDTPEFDAHQLLRAKQAVEQLPATTLPMLLAHHNVLPQATPRVQIYTETLNAGKVRSCFASCEHPVLYCHGHVHDDPVEVVENPETARRGRLVCVSAPRLADGFNLISIEYSSKGVPLGCLVGKYRRTRYGMALRSTVRIPLQDIRNAHNVVASFVGKVTNLTSKQPEYLRDIVARARHASNITHPEKKIANALLEAEWLGAVQIDGRDDANAEAWHVRRLEP